MTAASQSASPDGAPAVEPPSTRARLAALGDVLGAPFKVIFGYLGDHATMLAQATAWLFRRPFRLRLFLEQMEFVGVGSLGIIVLVGFFSGAVAAQQAMQVALDEDRAPQDAR